MPNPRKFPPSILHHTNGRDRLRIDGEDVWLGRRDSPEARAAYGRVVALMSTREDHQVTAAEARVVVRRSQIDPSGMTVHAVVTLILREIDQTYDPAGHEPAMFRLSFAPLLRLFGDLPAAAFDADALETLQRAMASGSWMNADERAQRIKQRQPTNWCRNVVNRRVTRIKTAWRLAEKKKWLPPGCYAALAVVKKLPKNFPGVRVTRPVRASALEELQAVLPHCPPKVAAMLQIQHWSGARPGEVRIIQTSAIDMSDPAAWVYVPGKHKSDWRDEDLERAIPLGPRCQEVLRPWLRPDQPDAYLFETKGGKPYSPDSYSNAVTLAAKRAGVRLTAYQQRHATKRRALKAGGLDGARVVLGQRSLASTAQYDAARDLETAKRIAAEIG